MDPSLWSRLPGDIPLRIALKLPFRELFRAKLVCKGWYQKITGLKAYAWTRHIICNEQFKDAVFSYLPRHLANILSCSRDGLILLHTQFYIALKNEPPMVVTNPVTRSFHEVPFPMLQYDMRLYATVSDTPHSFTVLMALSSGGFQAPVQGFWVCLYKPEAGWETKYIHLGNDAQLVLLWKSGPAQPLVFDGSALYFLTVPASSSSFHEAKEHTLNCVHVTPGDGESYKLEKLYSWSSLPRGMWQAGTRAHPKLVISAGRALLVGASFMANGQQGPVVLLAFERETKTWRVFDEVTLPGYAAKSKINAMYCDGKSMCGVYRECYCYEDLIVRAWDDEILFAFPDATNKVLSHDYSYDILSRRLSKFVFPVVDTVPVHRLQLARMYFSSRGRLPDTPQPEQHLPSSTH